eukprot:12405824-Karenia_brevis.AAC.1
MDLMDNDGWNVFLCTHIKPSKSDDVILELTQKELDKGQAVGFFSKSQLDAKFGRGSWRASRRWVLWQDSHGKYRAIDHYKTSHINLASSLWETIYTPSPDMPIIVLLNAAKLRGVELDSLPQYVLGCEDMEDAY